MLTSRFAYPHATWRAVFSFLAGVFVLCHGQPVQAQPTIEARAGLQAERLIEYRSSYAPGGGGILLTETGVRPVLGLALEVPWQHWAVRSELLLAGGHLDYDGQTNVGSPFQTRTLYREVSLDIGLTYRAGNVDWLGGLREESRHRHILGSGSVAGLREHYRQRWLVMGARIESGLWRWRLDGLHGISGRQRIQFENTYDTAFLPLGDSWGMEAAVSYAVSKYGTVELLLRHLDSGRSETVTLRSGGVPTGATVYQPAMRRQALVFSYQQRW